MSSYHDDEVDGLVLFGDKRSFTLVHASLGRENSGVVDLRSGYDGKNNNNVSIQCVRYSHNT